MKNSIKLLLLGLITPLLCGVSFGVPSFDLFENFSSNLILNTTLDEGRTISLEAYHYYCYYVDDTNYGPWNIYNLKIQGDGGGYSTYSTVSVTARSSVCFMAYADDSHWPINSNNYSSASIKVYEFVSPLIEPSPCDCPSCNDCSSIESDLTQCQQDLTSCQSSNCDTQLSQCIIDRDNYSSSVSSLSGSLATCNEDKTSLQNYNDSLTDQLNQCLEGGLSGENISGSFLSYSMFWQDTDSMFSLPITNDLFLPNGYKGKLDEDNVLSIAKLNTLETAYQFSDDDKVTIIDLLSMVMLFLLVTGSLIGLIVFLKRLVIKK